MHLMILRNSAQTSKEIRKYLTIVIIFVYNPLLQNKESGQYPVHYAKEITILNYFKIFPILNCWSTNLDNVILI
jgi:hypothetical protein